MQVCYFKVLTFTAICALASSAQATSTKPSSDHGSLTTPPCSEGVNWFVLTDPVQIGIEQVSRFAKAAGPNNRPLQPKNHRLVLAPGAAK